MFDIHTHHLPVVPGAAIVNVMPGNFLPFPGHWYSIGFHPWYADEDLLECDNALRRDFEQQICHPQVLAVGEAGIDKLARTPLSVQIDLFRFQVSVAETVCKPLIIHAVKVQAELIRLKRELKPRMPWVIHGFRGKAQLARELVRHGLYLSFGVRYQEEAMRQLPADRLFLETDESDVSIADLYRRAALVRGVACSELEETVSLNVQSVFFGH